MKRVILAAIVGGIGMFVWNFVAHDVLPLGESGIRELPNEPAAIANFKEGTADKGGLYYFPGPGLGPNPTREEKAAVMKHMNEKLAASPSGMLLYHPAGREMNMGPLLGIEFATECAEVLLAAFLLRQTTLRGFAAKFGFFLVAGVLTAIATNIPYWNWYGFPKHFIGAAILMQIVGFAVAGLVGAPLVRTKSSAA